MSARETSRRVDIDALHRARPRSRLVRTTWLLIPALVMFAWLSDDMEWGEIFNGRRLANLQRFVSEELCPYPLRGKPFDFAVAWDWAVGLLRGHGIAGAMATLSISVLAITLAGLAAAMLIAFAARNVSNARPFQSFSTPDVGSPVESGLQPGVRLDRDGRRRLAWRALTTLTRAFLIFLRAIPEYVWAFLFLAMLGPSAWPAVLALAIHNAGILGKLGAETVENLEAGPLRALSELGGRRSQIAVQAILPLSLSRFLLYFFYRFETCVREATVLGMLGVVSLGYWIQDARSKHYYDEMLLLVALGAAIVLLGDLVSAAARAHVRRAS